MNIKFNAFVVGIDVLHNQKTTNKYITTYNKCYIGIKTIKEETNLDQRTKGSIS